MQKLLLRQETNFEDPKDVVMNFILSMKLFGKKSSIIYRDFGEKEFNRMGLEIIHFYTSIKYHPYSNRTWDVGRIARIKEIESIERINKSEYLVITKRIQNQIASCRFTLKMSHKKWKVTNIELVQGVNHYYSLIV